MSKKNSIRDSLKMATKTDDEVYSIVCTVSNVTDDKCDCSPINGEADFLGVRLQASVSTGILIKPKDGSIVIVTMINKTTGYVAMFSEIDNIILNGDNYDGLVRVNDLTTKLNQLITELTTQLGLIATGITAGGGSYTPGTLSNFSANDYKNTTIKHGNG